MFNNIMSGRPPSNSNNNNVLFPFVILCLVCWTLGTTPFVFLFSILPFIDFLLFFVLFLGIKGSSQRIGQRQTAAAAAATIERGDWKPIDYGHPMRDPTLVYGKTPI